MTQRILIVDDDLPLQRALACGLTAAGYEVETARTGPGGLACAREGPDLILLDVGLPGLSGDCLIRNLRRWSDVPIIVQSAITDPTVRSRALQEGADDYISKPFALGDLLPRIHDLLEHRTSSAWIAAPVVHI